MTTLAALLLFVSSFHKSGQQGLVRDLQDAKLKAGASYQRYLRDATFLVSKELSNQDWDSAKKLLIAEGVEIDEQPSWGERFARLKTPGTDFITSSNVILRLEVTLSVKPRTSESSRSSMAVAYAMVDLLAEPEQDFQTFSAGKPFAKDSVLGLVLARPAVVTAAKDHPIVDKIRLEYHLRWFPRSAYPPESLPYVFEATMSLAKGPKWHRSGIEFKYSAQSALDPEADLKGQSVDPTYVGKDMVGDLELPAGGSEKDFLTNGYTNFINQFVIQRIAPDSAEVDLAAKAYSRGDLATLPLSTKEIEVFGESFKSPDLDLLTRFPNLERLDFSQVEPFTWASPHDFLVIGRLKGLRVLYLPIVDAPLSLGVIKAIAGLPRLETLRVYNSTLTPEEFRLLCGIKTLKVLQARFCTGLDDAAVATLSRNHHLRSLDILGTTGFAGKSFGMLGAPSLQELVIGPLPPSAVKVLPEIIKKSPLLDLSLTKCAISQGLMSSISKQHGLRNVSFSSCTGLNDVMIQNLDSLSRPDWIEFDECPNVSEEAVKNLMNKLKGQYQIL